MSQLGMSDLSGLASLMSLFNNPPQPPPAAGSPVPYVVPNNGQDVIDLTVQPLPEHTGPHGSPEDDAIYAAMTQDAAQRIGEIDFGGPISDIQINGQMFAAMGGPLAGIRSASPAMGGLLDSITGMFTSATSSTIAALGGATKAGFDKVKGAVNKLDARITGVERSLNSKINTNTGRIGRVETTTRQLAQKWNQYNGTQERWKRTVMAVAQAYPGVKSHRELHDPSFVAFVDVFKRVFASIEAKETAPAFEADNNAGAVYDQAEINAILLKIREDRDELADKVRGLQAVINEFAGGVLLDESHKKSAEKVHAYLSNTTLIDQIACILPSQYNDTNQAMYEMAAKLFLAKPTAAGSGGILGSLGL